VYITPEVRTFARAESSTSWLTLIEQFDSLPIEDFQQEFEGVRVDRLLLGSMELSLDPSELLLIGAPIQPGFDGPRLTRRHGLAASLTGDPELDARLALYLHEARAHRGSVMRGVQ